MRSRRKSFVIIFIFFFAVMIGSGCAQKKEEQGKKVEFTVVEFEDIPMALKEIIDEKKEEPFKLSYGDEGYLYIVQGYGMQTGGGYSITVDELSETENNLYICTSLIGPDGEKKKKGETYPYIVVKTEYMEKDVLYEP